MVRFRNRQDAGRQLAAAVDARQEVDPVVVALPRGGVPVGYEVARRLRRPLEVLVVRKLGAPLNPEYAFGAIAEGGEVVVDRAAAAACGVSDSAYDSILLREHRELDRRVERYRRGNPPPAVDGRTVIVIDDGVATGATNIAAARALRRMGAARIVFATPVAPRAALRRLDDEMDDVICLKTPLDFVSVGSWYSDFGQTTDREVVTLLDAAADQAAADAPAPEPTTVRIPFGTQVLRGDLRLPPNAAGLVVFAHGSGSSRLSPRNMEVADELGRRGLATLLFDLLTPSEAADAERVFDTEFLAGRLTQAVQWARSRPELTHLPLGLFGASTGVGAALRCAADLGAAVSAVVSRGGRPDLAAERLPEVTADTMLIVGGEDPRVLELNREAAQSLRCRHRIAIVSGATHLFEEPGAMRVVERLAADWFLENMKDPHPAPPFRATATKP